MFSKQIQFAISKKKNEKERTQSRCSFTSRTNDLKISRRFFRTKVGLGIGIIAGAIALLFNGNNNYSFADDGDLTRKKPRILVLGTGWASIAFLRQLNTKNYDVTIVSPRNYFLFTPLLASSAVGTVDFRSIVEPIRALARRKGIEFVEGKCTDVDFDKKTVECKGDLVTTTIPYDHLIVAVGSFSNTFGVPGVTENAHFLKTVEDAQKIKDRIMDCLEMASFPSTPVDVKRKLLNFVIVGGGPTGVEFAGELSDFVFNELHKYYPHVEEEVKVTLVQSGDHILNAYERSISEYAEERFMKKKVDVRTNARVLKVDKDGVELMRGDQKELIPYGLVLWATGIMAPLLIDKLINKIPEQTHSKVLITDSFCKVKGVNDVYALGDCATVSQEKVLDHFVELFKEFDANGDGYLDYNEFCELLSKSAPRYPQLAEFAARAAKTFEEADLNHDNRLELDEFKAALKKIDSKITALPATAQRATSQGKYLANSFNDLVRGKAPTHFHFKSLGSIAYVGGDVAVGEMGSWRLTGFQTWLMWRALVWAEQGSLRNKTLLAFDWTKNILFGRDISRF